MAAGKTYQGRNLRIRIGGETIFHSTECQFSTSRQFDGIASKDTDGNIQTPGSYEWGITGNVLVADKAALSSDEDIWSVLTKYLNGDEVAVEFTTDIAGDKFISGNMYFSSVNMSAPTNGVATGDFALVGNGNFTIATVTA